MNIKKVDAKLSQTSEPPVLTIDGPSGVGKGTLALRVAQSLDWYLLDSGVIYRAIAWAIIHYKIPLSNSEELTQLLKRVQIAIDNYPLDKPARVMCDGYEITDEIRFEACGVMASSASALPLVRESVLQYQRDFCRWPGLVADGRDMGTVVFPGAVLKFFLQADSAVRAYRRYQQLHEQGISVSLAAIQQDLEERDRRDINRFISPTIPADDAIIINTTNLSIDTVFAFMMQHAKERGVG